MGVNKVLRNTENGLETVMDISDSSVTPTTLAMGTTAYNSNGEKITGEMPTDVVRYGSQTLTEAQKTQARANIGAVNETELTEQLAAAKASGEFKGEKGDKGDKGDKGVSGYTPIKGVDYFDGIDGSKGADGKTPVKGVDYYTEADKAEFSTYIATELAKRGQLKPEKAYKVGEMTDTSKLYVLLDKTSPDYGYLFAHMLTEVEAPSSYTNVLPLAVGTDNKVYNGTGYKNGWRLNSSGVESERSKSVV